MMLGKEEVEARIGSWYACLSVSAVGKSLRLSTDAEEPAPWCGLEQDVAAGTTDLDVS